MMFARHDRVWLNAAGWQAARRQAAAHADILTQWERNDWPAIVRRHDGVSTAETLCLGLPLPPDPHGIKLRLPFTLTIADVARHAAPLAIDDAIPTLPAAWQEPLTDLAGAAALGGLQFHVYGSAAMQAMTALPYLRATSDIDLLFAPRDRGQLHDGLQLLRLYARHLPLDGEIVFPSGRAVAWKEWLGAPDAGTLRILTKNMHAVALVEGAELQAELA